MKEYEVVLAMAEGYGNRYAKLLEFVTSSISNKNYDLLKLDAVKTKMLEVIQALEVKIRYDALYEKASGKLSCNNSTFEFDGHKFATLDEVEKAIKNKAFL